MEIDSRGGNKNRKTQKHYQEIEKTCKTKQRQRHLGAKS